MMLAAEVKIYNLAHISSNNFQEMFLKYQMKKLNAHSETSSDLQ